MTPAFSAIVPTLGRSDTLLAALGSLRNEGQKDLEIIVVAQGVRPLDSAVRDQLDRLIEVPEPLGFAAANNVGLASARAPRCLLLNDDAELHSGWLATCNSLLDEDPTLAAVQGHNLLPAPAGDTPRLDGAGISWSASGWQARQIGHGESASTVQNQGEVFGASATACLLRRSALEATALEGHVFDERLHTYYEDVELAIRLRSAGWRAVSSRRATATHQGGSSAGSLGRRRFELLYGNRHLTVARLLGRDYPRQRRSLLLRDLRDLVRQPKRLAGILAGWRRAATLARHFVHDGPPLIPWTELRRFGVGS